MGPFLRPGPPRGRTYGRSRRAPLASLPQSRKSFPPASPAPPATWSLSARPSMAIQISQPDFILVSRIFFIAPGPGASLSPPLPPPLPLFRPLPRLRTRAPYVISATVYMRKAQGAEAYKRGPMFGALLIGQFTRCAFSCLARSHRDVFASAANKTPSRSSV